MPKPAAAMRRESRCGENHRENAIRRDGANCEAGNQALDSTRNRTQRGNMRRIALFVLACFVLTWAVSTATAQSYAPAPARLDGKTLHPAQIDSTVTGLMQKAHVPGVGVALFRSGTHITYLKAYGQRDTEKGRSADSGSVMTAALADQGCLCDVVMRLVEAGTLSLDAPIQHYLPKPLPEYPQYADLKDDERYKKITLRMLLSHTAGFANFHALEPDNKLHIHFEPGSRFAYSGDGINLAQFVVEMVTGKSATVLMQEQLFGPLGIGADQHGLGAALRE